MLWQRRSCTRAFLFIIVSLMVIMVGLLGCLTDISSPEPTLESEPAATVLPSEPPPSTHEPTPTATPTPEPMPTPSKQASTPTSPAPTPTPSLADIPETTLAAHFGFLGASYDAAALAELGVIWDRPHPGPFIWGSIEREKGEYSWGEVDRYVHEAQRYGFATLATIWPFAGWDQAGWGKAVASGIVFEEEVGTSRHKPYNMDAYRAFVSALVERYDGDGEDDMPGLKFPIKYWEASNEPSMQDGFNTFFDGSPDDYFEILETTYQAVKDVDPEAKVLHAGMAGMEPWMVSFWKPIFEQGSQYFDIANIHSIGASEELNVPAFRELLSAYGIDKPIWVTEAQHRTGMTFTGKNVSLEEHARIFVKSYVLSFALGTDKIFYTSFKAPPFGEDEFQQAALIDADGEARPAYYAMRMMIAKLDGFTFAGQLAEGQYQFSVDGKTVYVLWDPNEIPEEIAGEVLVTDIYNEETRTDSSSIELTGSPIFVERIHVAD